MDENNVYIVLAAAFLSLLFFYVPGFKGWYEKQTSEMKQLINLILIAVIVVADYGVKLYTKAVVFNFDTVASLLATFFFAITVNAGIYKGINYIANGKPKG